MPLPRPVVEHLVEIVQEAESGILDEVRRGEVVDEPSLTNRFFEKIKTLVEVRGGYGNLRFYAHTLVDRGQNSPEHRFGADFCVTLAVSMRDFELRKGFLGQAKRESDWISLQGTPTSTQQLDERASIGVRLRDASKLTDLQSQVWKMLRLTPVSFVVVYGASGFVVVPASSVKAMQGSGEIQGMPVGKLFRQFFSCFVGDHRLQAANKEALERLAREQETGSSLFIGVDERPPPG